MRPLVLLVTLLAACSDDFVEFDAATHHDAGIPDESTAGEGGVTVQPVFTITGCDSLTFDASGRPTCSAAPEHALTFIPLGTGVESVLWTFPSGTPASSTQLTPEVTWTAKGSFTISLTAGAGGGSAIGTGLVQVIAGSDGATCLVDGDCDATQGLTCLCGAGSHCPSSLSAGICVKACGDGVCPPSTACIDLQRGSEVPDGGVPDGGLGSSFRDRVCLPLCTTDGDCRAGLACLALPSDTSTGSGWTKACFANVLGGDGAPCFDETGAPDDTRCLSGHCEALGARGICTEACGNDVACPSGAVCAAIASLGPRCLATCTTAADCDDPLVACQGPGAGGLGFSLPETAPPATLLCAPKRCEDAADCTTPGASCTPFGAASFCQR